MRDSLPKRALDTPRFTPACWPMPPETAYAPGPGTLAIVPRSVLGSRAPIVLTCPIGRVHFCDGPAPSCTPTPPPPLPMAV